MRKITPASAIALVLLIGAAVVVADYALDGGFGRSGFQRVAPGRDGNVTIEVADLEPGDVRFYRYLNPGNQEVKFFVGRDSAGALQVAFDANEICFKRKRGYRYEDGWLVCNTCDKAFRLDEVNEGRGGCAPVPVEHRVEGERLILADAALLQGWRFFR